MFLRNHGELGSGAWSEGGWAKLEVEACCSEQQRWEADGRQHEDQIEQVLFLLAEKIWLGSER